MKKRIILLAALFCCQVSAQAADLVEVFQQALVSDPIYQQAVSQRLSTREGVPINVAALLPTITANLQPSVTRTGYSGSLYEVLDGITVNPRNATLRSSTLALTITQTIFDFGKFSSAAGAAALARGADATLNYALQNLMTRTASAYFAILRDEDNLSYSEASKLAYQQQLDQVKQQYNVGLKTITDVYTAQASYDSAVATYIAAETTLQNDRENLRVITGKYYGHLSSLSEDFPLLSPEPNDIEQWVRIAQMQNWSIKTARYSVENAMQVIRRQFAGHLPTVSVQASMNRMYQDSVNGTNSFNDRSGPGAQTDRSLALTMNLPIFSGGGVIAQTNRASYDYDVAQQQLEQTVRSTINITRQSYLNIISGISKIKADKQAVKSSISSWEGLEASYRVGTETLVDVLNQQQKIFQAQTDYATDRYAFVNNIFLLKQAAGVLSFDDLRAINAWLTDKKNTHIGGKAISLTRKKTAGMP